MNQMGPQSPALDPPLTIRHITSYRMYFMTYFTIHVIEMTTQKCTLSMGKFHSQDHSPAI